MSESVISLKGIEKSYGKHKVLTDVNLEIHKGDIFGLVGRNGAGKTTLFKVILGLSPYEKGELTICGDSKDLSAGRAKIGFMVGSNYFDGLNARQNLEYYCRLKGVKDKSVIDEVLKTVDLYGVKKPVKRYSMGMRQRLGIANALLSRPEILILDEPTNGLDPQGIADIRTLVQKLNEERGMTVIISSHILGELQHTAHRFGIVNEGTVPRTITQEDLLTEQKAVRVSVDDLEKAREALKNAGVKILNEVQETKSLEDYYFGLVGGEEHV